MTYQIGKQYYIENHYWLCTAITKAYASFERTDRPSIKKMVRARNSV